MTVKTTIRATGDNPEPIVGAEFSAARTTESKGSSHETHKKHEVQGKR